MEYWEPIIQYKKDNKIHTASSKVMSRKVKRFNRRRTQTIIVKLTYKVILPR